MNPTDIIKTQRVLASNKVPKKIDDNSTTIEKQ